jgi:hypothetical protein
MSDPHHGDDWTPPDRAKKDGVYEARSISKRQKIDERPVCAGKPFGSVDGYPDSDVRWSTEPIRRHTCRHEEAGPGAVARG